MDFNDLEFTSRISEIEAAQKVILLSNMLGARPHLAHITCKETAELVAKAKREGLPVTSEVTTHHLWFTQESARALGPFGRFHPHVRHPPDLEALWHHLNSGDIDIVVSDHAPRKKEDVEAAGRDSSKTIGMAGNIQLLGPLMLTWWAQQRLSLDSLLKVCCTNPAKLFGLFPRKGCATYMLGADADLVIVDPKKSYKIAHDAFFSKSKDAFVQFDGFEAKMSIKQTIVGGQLVYDSEEGILGEPRGKMLRGPRFQN